jgi:hypothetical protein
MEIPPNLRCQLERSKSLDRPGCVGPWMAVAGTALLRGDMFLESRVIGKLPSREGQAGQVTQNPVLQALRHAAGFEPVGAPR